MTLMDAYIPVTAKYGTDDVVADGQRKTYFREPSAHTGFWESGSFNYRNSRSAAAHAESRIQGEDYKDGTDTHLRSLLLFGRILPHQPRCTVRIHLSAQIW